MFEEKTIQTGSRVIYSLSMKAKIENIFDDKEIERVRQSNILLIVKKLIKDFTLSTGNEATMAILPGDVFYLLRQEIQKETGEYQSSENTKIGEVKIRSGCEVTGSKVIISSWCDVSEDNEIIEAWSRWFTQNILLWRMWEKKYSVSAPRFSSMKWNKRSEIGISS